MNNYHSTSLLSSLLTRRKMLQRFACGFGSLALTDILAQNSLGNPSAKVTNPLAPKPPHIKPRAKRVIFLFMAGGPSQVDTFDYKPLLHKLHGKSFGQKIPGVPKKFADLQGLILDSPFKFRQHGESGKWVSSLFPNISKHVDDLCFLHGMHTEGFDHGQAGLFFHTGASNFVRPSLGSWVSYGLGTENQTMPSFIHLGPSSDFGGVRIHSNAFLPSFHQGTAIGSSTLPVKQSRVRDLSNTENSKQVQLKQLQLLRELDREHQQHSAADGDIEGLIQSFETAFQMQTTASEILDLSKETKQTHQKYGLNERETDDFGRQCLMARRLAESGVRFTLVTHSIRKTVSTMREWDQHNELEKYHTINAKQVDQPIAALLDDLKIRGLLDDTLVIWAGEFGRTPMIEIKKSDKINKITKKVGRDHNPLGFTLWMAGGGVKKGYSHGATDDIGYLGVEGRAHTHELHATILHLLGLDHRKLAFQQSGLDVRLTGVNEVDIVREIIA